MNHSYQKSTITLEAAVSMIEAARERATQLGIGIAVTVIDESGIPKAFGRMDNAPLIAVDASRKKAVTAVGFGLSTGKSWHDFIKDDPILSGGVNNVEDFLLLGGGLPIYEQERLIGAIGVSGGHYKQDEDCGSYALKKVFTK